MIHKYFSTETHRLKVNGNPAPLPRGRDIHPSLKPGYTDIVAGHAESLPVPAPKVFLNRGREMNPGHGRDLKQSPSTRRGVHRQFIDIDRRQEKLIVFPFCILVKGDAPIVRRNIKCFPLQRRGRNEHGKQKIKNIHGHRLSRGFQMSSAELRITLSTV